MTDLREQLRRQLAGCVCFLGLGNVDYGDDGFGVHLAEKLFAAGVVNVVIAGTVPERNLNEAVCRRSEHIVFLDTVDIAAPAGSVVFLDATAIAARFPQVSTHKISVALLSRWVEANGAKAWLLGVQPESLRPARQLTNTVQATVDVLSELLTCLNSQPTLPAAAGSQAIAEVHV